MRRSCAIPRETCRDKLKERTGAAIRRQANEYVFSRIYDEDEDLSVFVRAVGEKIIQRAQRDRPNLRLDVQILDEAEPIASLFLGYGVMVNTGALARLSSEAELASVIAHEVAHAVIYRTALSTESPFTGLSISLDSPSDDHANQVDEERLVDQLAVDYVRAAGYDPRSVSESTVAVLFSSGYREKIDSVADIQRLSMLALISRRNNGAQGGVQGSKQCFEHLDGLAIDEGPARVQLEDGRVYLSTAGLSFELPHEWKFVSKRCPGACPEPVVAASPAGEHQLFIRVFGSHIPKNVPIEALSGANASSFETNGVRHLRVEMVERAPSLLLDGKRGPAVSVSFAGAVSLEAHEAIMRGVLESLRSEPGRPTPPDPRLRLRVITTERAATIEEHVRAGCGTAEQLALIGRLNRRQPDERLPPGTLLKCVRKSCTTALRGCGPTN